MGMNTFTVDFITCRWYQFLWADEQ